MGPAVSSSATIHKFRMPFCTFWVLSIFVTPVNGRAASTGGLHHRVGRDVINDRGSGLVECGHLSKCEDVPDSLRLLMMSQCAARMQTFGQKLVKRMRTMLRLQWLDLP